VGSNDAFITVLAFIRHDTVGGDAIVETVCTAMMRHVTSCCERFLRSVKTDKCKGSSSVSGNRKVIRMQRACIYVSLTTTATRMCKPHYIECLD
jgi:hypothetical protein